MLDLPQSNHLMGGRSVPPCHHLFTEIMNADNEAVRTALADIDPESLLSLKNNEGQPLLHYTVIHQNFPAFKLIIDKLENSGNSTLKQQALLATDAQGTSLLAYINTVPVNHEKFLYTWANLLKNQRGENPLLGFDSVEQRQSVDLKAAIESGDLKAVQYYSDQGNSFKVRDPATHRLLDSVVQSEQPECVERQRVAIPQEQRLQSLDIVVQTQQSEIVQRVKVHQPGGNTPLHSAVQADQLAIIQHIVACDPQLLFWTDFSGQTALQLAQQRRQSGADNQSTQQAIIHYLSTQEQALSDPETLKQRTEQQVFRSIIAGGITDLDYFLKSLTDLTPLLTLKNQWGQSLLHCAINTRDQLATDLIVGKLEENAQDAVVQQLLSLTDNQGNSVLHYAVARQDISLLCRLVAAGADLSIENHEQVTAHQQYQIYQPAAYRSLDRLPQEIEKGNLTFIKEYMAQGFPLSVRYREGNTPLHIAAQKNQPEIVQYWVENVPEQLLTAKNFFGQTPAELALAAGETQKKQL